MLARLGGLAARRPWLFVAAWLLLMAAAVPLAQQLPGRLSKAAMGVPGSESTAVSSLLQRDFANPFVEPLLVAVRSKRFRVTDPPFQASLNMLAHDLRRSPAVARVMAPGDAGLKQGLVGPDDHTAVVLVGPAGGPEEAGGAVAAVRDLARPTLTRLKKLDPDLASGVTGPAALANDVIAANAVDSSRAEGRVMIPALLLLLWVFASPLAAALPLALGVVATLMTLAAAALLSGIVALNSYVQTAGTMLGLALGIDYALIVVGRYREERALPPEERVGAVLRTAGWTVLTSGVVVLAAMTALVPSGLIELQSVGVGTALTVFWAAALATTLLPALLVLLDRWLDAPVTISRFLLERRTGERWRRWGLAVTKRRWAAGLAVLVALVALAWPAGRFVGGLPDGRWYPADLEAVRGQDVLAGMHRMGLAFPFLLVVERTDGQDVLGPPGLAAMVGLSKSLRARPEVADLLGPVDLPGGPRGVVGNILFYRSPAAVLKQHPDIGQLLVSRDGKQALIQVVLRDDVTLSRAKALVKALRAEQPKGLRVRVGGLAAGEADLEDRQRAYAPMELGLVFASTFVLLFAAFRSVAVPLKAIALNLLAVGAAMGVIVRVFQDGLGGAWVGLAAPLGSVPITLPLLIFCLTFGLSMDYEIFMLARVQEARRRHEGEGEAIADGLAGTANVITAAAGIMVVVFGAFIWADMVLVKILGFGLAVAITLDATVVRMVLAPAVLSIAGRWNWWPGDKS